MTGQATAAVAFFVFGIAGVVVLLAVVLVAIRVRRR